MATPSIPANAYPGRPRRTEAAGLAKPAGDASAGPTSFGQLVKDAIGSVQQSARASDGQSQAMAAGKGNLVDVVTAVSETEVAIDTLVSVRDKVISAYEEIMKMPI